MKLGQEVVHYLRKVPPGVGALSDVGGCPAGQNGTRVGTHDGADGVGRTLHVAIPFRMFAQEDGVRDRRRAKFTTVTILSMFSPAACPFLSLDLKAEVAVFSREVPTFVDVGRHPLREKLA